MGRKARRQDLFERVAMPHFAAVYDFGFSLIRSPSLAEDLTQETFLNAYRNFEAFRVGTNCKAWLFKICKNLFIDQFRMKKRRPQHLAIDDSEPTQEDLPRDRRAFEVNGIDSEAIFFDLFGDEVNRFLQELPGDFRRALLLCDLDGMSYEEIAELMDTPIGTVRSRISRARSVLREKLEDYARELGYLRVSDPDCDETSGQDCDETSHQDCDER
ncbi:MAG: sigma-70 family RNA polymerase sigma factor [Planctomycetota bacterium]